MLLRDRVAAANALDPRDAEDLPVTHAWRRTVLAPRSRTFGDFLLAGTLSLIVGELWRTELHWRIDIAGYQLKSVSRRVSKILALDRFAVTWMAPIDMVRTSQSHFPLDNQRTLHAERWAKLISELIDAINTTRRQIIDCRMWRDDMVAHGRSLICGVPIIVATATHILNLARSYWDHNASYSVWTKDNTTEVLEECINDLGLGISLIGEHISRVSITVVAADNTDGQDPPHQPIHVGTFNLDVNANP
jgi:hypothetical protein